MTKIAGDRRRKAGITRGGIMRMGPSTIAILVMAVLGCLVFAIHLLDAWYYDGVTTSLTVINSAMASSPVLQQQQQQQQQQVHMTTGSIGSTTVQPVSCKHHSAKDDPNAGMSVEEGSKYVNKIDPAFWISLHKEYYDRMRYNAIMKKGEYYETGLTAQFKEILHSKPKGLVIDVGMNIGWFTLYSRAMGHDVIAFDPNPLMHRRVCESLAQNQWVDDNSVKTFAYGLGETPAILNLTLGNNPGGSSFHEDRLAKKFRRYLSVPVTTLDILAKEQGLLLGESSGGRKMTIHLLKIDVEGYEPQVFRGAKNLIGSGLIQNIIMESSVKDFALVVEMFGRLAESGYRIHRISDVNGHPYHPEMVEPVNEALSANNDELLRPFTALPCNIWWQLQ